MVDRNVNVTCHLHILAIETHVILVDFLNSHVQRTKTWAVHVIIYYDLLIVD